MGIESHIANVDSVFFLTLAGCVLPSRLISCGMPALHVPLAVQAEIKALIGDAGYIALHRQNVQNHSADRATRFKRATRSASAFTCLASITTIAYLAVLFDRGVPFNSNWFYWVLFAFGSPLCIAWGASGKYFPRRAEPHLYQEGIDKAECIGAHW